MAAIALGLSSSLCWGFADFMGGIQSRRYAALSVTAVSQAAGTVLIVVVVLASGRAAPGVTSLLPAAAAGAAGAVALVSFYRALAIGTMSVVAPIAATGAVVPVAVGLAGGDRPGPLQALGMAAAVIGVVLASREFHDDAERRAAGRTSVWLALAAALGFGLFFVGLKASASHDILWTLLAARVGALIALAGPLIALRSRLAVGVRSLPVIAVIGVLDISANGLFAVASTKGLLSVVSVVSALYPVATVLLARFILKERVLRVQAVGIVAALAGVALIAAG